MTKDELIAFATRNEEFSDEDIETIEQELLDSSSEDAYDVLMKVNSTNEETQKKLMVKLSNNETLYEKISTFVKSREDSAEEESA